MRKLSHAVIMILFCAIGILFSGCSAETHRTSNLMIMGSIQGVESGGNVLAAYQAIVMLDDSPVDSATITCSGPHGTTPLAYVGNGIYSFSEMNQQYYQAGSSYTMTVNIDGTIYTGAIIPPGDITIDAEYVTWTIDGNQDLLMIIDSQMNPHNFNPDIDSPFLIASYLTSGANNVTMTCCTVNTGQFAGSHASSSIIAQYMKVQQITK